MNDVIILVYILNSILLVLHEIESAYEKEWEILHIPGRISFFLLLHIPILLIMFYGLIFVIQESLYGFFISIVLGVGGLIPFFVHKVFKNKKDAFNRSVSNILIFGNIITGLLLLITVVKFYGE
jgi:hypothetical protein